jgi:acetyl esterase/lipase
MSLSKSSLPPTTLLDAETRRLADAAWERWAPTCCWFMRRLDFNTVGDVEEFLRQLRKNGGMAAWRDAREIAAKIA